MEFPTVISDNGPQFVSEEFKNFSMEWMFNHVTTSPSHSQSNGMVESSVKIAKNILRTSMTANEDPCYTGVQKYANLIRRHGD